MTRNISKYRAQAKHILGVLLPPWIIQILFNQLSSSDWHTYWPLVLVSSAASLSWLIFQNSPSAYSAMIIQTCVLLWFNWNNYSSKNISFSGESAFVGGLGAVYAVALSISGGMLIGGALYLFQRER